MSCERCGRTVYLAEGADKHIRILELIEPAFRIDEQRMIPIVGVYVDHPSRCPGAL